MSMERTKEGNLPDFVSLVRTDEREVFKYLLEQFGISSKEGLMEYNDSSIMVVFTSTNKKNEYTEVLFARREGTKVYDPVYIRFDPESDEGTPSVYMLKKGKVEKIDEKDYYVFITDDSLTNKEVGIIVKTGKTSGIMYFYFELAMEGGEETDIAHVLLATPFDSFKKLPRKTVEKFKGSVEKGFQSGGSNGSLLMLSEAVNEYLVNNKLLKHCGIVSFGYEAHTDSLRPGIEYKEAFPLLLVVPLSLDEENKKSFRAIKQITPIIQGWDNVRFKIKYFPKESKEVTIDSNGDRPLYGIYS